MNFKRERGLECAQTGATIVADRPYPVCNLIMPTICKHPRVRIVSRQDDIEFVECQDCGEVFDSDEFRDMEIEEKDRLTANSEDQEPG